MQYCYFESPIGKLVLAGENSVLELISFEESAAPANAKYYPLAFGEAVKQLNEYFTGLRKSFSIAFKLGGTNFQKEVLENVACIPYGTTLSYGAIANNINNSKAVRAVGMANATNRLPILIPCHRVIGKNGSLTGFAGGIERKKYLIDMESQYGKILG